MQFDSAARLVHLEALHKSKSAAARDAQRARNGIIAAATAARRAADEAEAEVKREQAATRMGIAERIAERMKGEPQTEDRTAKAARLRARADELDAALAQADQQAAETRDRATDAGRVLSAVQIRELFQQSIDRLPK